MDIELGETRLSQLSARLIRPMQSQLSPLGSDELFHWTTFINGNSSARSLCIPMLACRNPSPLLVRCYTRERQVGSLRTRPQTISWSKVEVIVVAGYNYYVNARTETYKPTPLFRKQKGGVLLLLPGC